jgi:hypothetical protein
MIVLYIQIFNFLTIIINQYTFYPKSEKPIKTVIRHPPVNIHAEEIGDGLVDLGFDVISAKQMSTALGLREELHSLLCLYSL